MKDVSINKPISITMKLGNWLFLMGCLSVIPADNSHIIDLLVDQIGDKSGMY